MPRTACRLARSPTALKNLGDRPRFSLTLNQMHGSRGLSLIICPFSALGFDGIVVFLPLFLLDMILPLMAPNGVAVRRRLPLYPETRRAFPGVRTSHLLCMPFECCLKLICVWRLYRLPVIYKCS